jgi:uncharacterized membrane protein
MIGVTSPFHSLTPKKAKEKRMLVKSPVGVEKVCHCTALLRPVVGTEPFWSLVADSQRCWLAEEAHQSLHVLRRCCQVELFPNELYSS